MRALVRSEVHVTAPARTVWDYVVDWPRQGEWIPMTRVEAVDDADRVGGRIRAWTGVGPVGFWDPMTITAWEVQANGSARCEVLHTGGVVRGDGEFAVVADGPEACTFVWWERLEVPGGALGALGWRVAGGAFGRGVDLALRRLADRVERDRVAG
jgi:hypothetical protein